MDEITKKEITSILQKCIDRTIKRIQNDETHRPFHEALLTKELVIASAFERSFSTSFGQGPIEEISRILAISTGAQSERQKGLMANVNKGAVDEIERLLSSLRAGESTPNWERELQRIKAFKKGEFVVRRVISDLWIKRNKDEIYISIKTVKPNIDQVEITKRSMLLIKAHDEKLQTYLGLYYNPGGETKADYNWLVPQKIFNMQKDQCVLIGKDYWDFIGGRNTYVQLLQIFKEVGEKTRKKILKM